MDIERVIASIIEREGGYVDHPADRGGPTKYGITLATLAGYTGAAVTAEDVRQLDEAVARRIIEMRYYRQPKLDLLPLFIQPFMLDSAVNHGPRRAVKFLQKVVDAAGFGPVVRDGLVGSQTAAATARAMAAMGPVLLRALVEERRMFYRRIVRRDPGQGVFLAGWLRRADAFEKAMERKMA